METIATGLIGTVILSKTTSVVTSIGCDLIINTITTTTSSICSIIKSVIIYDIPGIEKVTQILKDTDLEFTINIIEELVKEQNGKNLNDSIKKALFGVNEILELIHGELTSIKKAIDYHNSLYLNSWRSFYYDYSKLDLMKQNEKILKHRYQMFLDLLKIYT